MSSTVPPLVLADLNLSPTPVPCALRFCASRCLIPPEVSLPKVISPPPFREIQLRITTYSVGRLTLRPSQSRPALRQKLSSLQSISQFCTRTKVDESISIPSVLGPLPPILFRITTPSTVIYFE